MCSVFTLLLTNPSFFIYGNTFLVDLSHGREALIAGPPHHDFYFARNFCFHKAFYNSLSGVGALPDDQILYFRYHFVGNLDIKFVIFFKSPYGFVGLLYGKNNNIENISNHIRRKYVQHFIGVSFFSVFKHQFFNLHFLFHHGFMQNT